MESSKIAMTTREVSEYLGVNSTRVQRWIRDGKMKCFKTEEGDTRVFLKQVYAFVKIHGFPNGTRMKPA
jgi:excisionase family DNA binding protein